MRHIIKQSSFKLATTICGPSGGEYSQVLPFLFVCLPGLLNHMHHESLHSRSTHFPSRDNVVKRDIYTHKLSATPRFRGGLSWTGRTPAASLHLIDNVVFRTTT